MASQQQQMRLRGSMGYFPSSAEEILAVVGASLSFA
jgi:hypothetical protein